MNNKDQPKKCESELCCKATAQLRLDIEKDKCCKDKPLAELLDENKNTEE